MPQRSRKHRHPGPPACIRVWPDLQVNTWGWSIYGRDNKTFSILHGVAPTAEDAQRAAEAFIAGCQVQWGYVLGFPVAHLPEGAQLCDPFLSNSPAETG